MEHLPIQNHKKNHADQKQAVNTEVYIYTISEELTKPESGAHSWGPGVQYITAEKESTKKVCNIYTLAFPFF